MKRQGRKRNKEDSKRRKYDEGKDVRSVDSGSVLTHLRIPSPSSASASLSSKVSGAFLTSSLSCFFALGTTDVSTFSTLPHCL